MNPLEKAESEYWDAVYKFAEQERQRLVIPYCNRTRRRFIAGNGGWSFGRKGDFDMFAGLKDPDTLPKYILKTLSLATLNRCNDLGSLMQDYTPPNFEN